jgi:hypothetical protein
MDFLQCPMFLSQVLDDSGLNVFLIGYGVVAGFNAGDENLKREP